MSAPPACLTKATTSAISALSMAMATSPASSPRALRLGANFPRARFEAGGLRRRVDFAFAFAVAKVRPSLCEEAVILARARHPQVVNKTGDAPSAAALEEITANGPDVGGFFGPRRRLELWYQSSFIKACAGRR